MLVGLQNRMVVVEAYCIIINGSCFPTEGKGNEKELSVRHNKISEKKGFERIKL